MKGRIFREFQNFVEARWSAAMVDSILSLPTLESGGAYTAVGNYPHGELVSQVVALSQATGTGPADIVRDFGRFLFPRLLAAHPEVAGRARDCIGMLAEIETVIHPNVRKLYPDAQLPRFEVEAREGDTRLVLTYRSSKPFADLAEGLILGAIAHFGLQDHASLTREDIDAGGFATRFDIRAGV